MFRLTWMAVLGAVLTAGPLAAADLARVERRIRKEPAYQTKAPKYGLLVFGPEAADRVWLVLDGDTLYVDRNGDGDLTEPGEKVVADKGRDPAEYGYDFEVGEVRVGGKVHKGLRVSFTPLTFYAGNPALANYAPLHAALKADPKALAASVAVDVESACLKGGGLGGRLTYKAGFHDLDGVFQFGDRPAQAPIVHLDGPLQITFYGERPTLRLAREDDLVLVVGTPGRGPGTFAMLDYEQTIPEKLYPQIEITFPAARPGDPSPRQHCELKERC
jgi:hypothetical protein